MDNIEWIGSVLDEVKEFAEENDLNRLAEQAVASKQIAMRELCIRKVLGGSTNYGLNGQLTEARRADLSQSKALFALGKI